MYQANKVHFFLDSTAELFLDRAVFGTVSDIDLGVDVRRERERLRPRKHPACSEGNRLWENKRREGGPTRVSARQKMKLADGRCLQEVWVTVRGMDGAYGGIPDIHAKIFDTHSKRSLCILFFFTVKVAWKRIWEKRLWVVIGYSQSNVAQINQEETTVFLLKWHYITFYTNNSGAHQFEKKKNLPPSQTSLITWECLTTTTARCRHPSMKHSSISCWKEQLFFPGWAV